MRTIEEVCSELRKKTDLLSHYQSKQYKVTCELLDEILEISKVNESAKGDLISKELVIDVIWDVFNQYCNDADRFDEWETKAIDRAFKRLQSMLEKQPTSGSNKFEEKNEIENSII